MLTPPAGSVALTRRLSIALTSSRQLLLFGAASRHTEDDPFVIHLDEIREATDVVDCMKGIATRGWGATPADLLTLASFLLDDLANR